MLNPSIFLQPLIGGALIGLSATLLLGTLGRVAGVSGIVGNLVALRRDVKTWQLGFVLGLIAVGVASFGRIHGSAAGTLGPALSIVAGLLVGFGTRMGNGCTSGHGVCGLSRLSLRSLVATGTFMLAAMSVVALSRHVMGGAP